MRMCESAKKMCSGLFVCAWVLTWTCMQLHVLPSWHLKKASEEESGKRKSTLSSLPHRYSKPCTRFFCFRFLLLASSITHCLASCRLCFSTSANTSTHPHTHTHTETSREMHGQLGRHTVEPGSQRARVEASAHVPVLQN